MPIIQLVAEINDKRREYLEALRAIVPVRPITSMDDVRSPATIEWAVSQLEGGASFDQIRALTGLLDEKKRYLWRKLKSQLTAHQLPGTELEALTEYYVRQEERIERFEDILSDLDKRIAAGPNDRVAKNSRGKEFVVEDKGFNALIDYRIKAHKMLCDEEEKRMKWFLDQKKTKLGGGKYQGATIHIHSNVPRPTLKEAEEILDDE